MSEGKARPFCVWVNELREFLKANGGRLPVYCSEDFQERCLYNWLVRQRSDNKRGKLSEEQKQIMCDVPGLSQLLQKWDGCSSEVSPNALAAGSGLSEEVLAALPSDAPAGHEAHSRVLYRPRQQIFFFAYGEAKIAFHVALNAVGGNHYAAGRIGRACYMKFEEGLPKDQVFQFRNEWYTKFHAALGGVLGDALTAATEATSRRSRRPAMSTSGSTTAKRRKRANKKANDAASGIVPEVVDLSETEEEPMPALAPELAHEGAAAEEESVCSVPTPEQLASPDGASEDDGAEQEPAASPPASPTAEVLEEVRRSFRLPEPTSPTAAFAALRREAVALAGGLKRARERARGESPAAKRGSYGAVAVAALQHVLDVLGSAPDPEPSLAEESAGAGERICADAEEELLAAEALAEEDIAISTGAEQAEALPAEDPYADPDAVVSDAAAASGDAPSAGPDAAIGAEAEEEPPAAGAVPAEDAGPDATIGADAEEEPPAAGAVPAEDAGPDPTIGACAEEELLATEAQAAEEAAPGGAPTAAAGEEAPLGRPVLRLSFPPGGVRRSRPQWAKDEMMAVFGTGFRRTLTREAVEELVSQPIADRIRHLGLTETCVSVMQDLPPPGEVTVDDFISCVLHTRAELNAAPLSFFRDASPEELDSMPQILSDFGAYLSALDVKHSSVKCFVRAIWMAVHFDRKAPEEMATAAYREFVRHTFEDASNNNCMSVALRKFETFWRQPGRRPLADYLVVDLEAAKQWGMRSDYKQRRLPTEGDGSEEARKEESLPEGWHVHKSMRRGTEGRVVGCTSPRGTFYKSRTERLNIGPPPVFMLPPPPQPPAPPAPSPGKKQETPEKVAAPPRVRLRTIPPATQTIVEACGTAPAAEAATALDKQLCPRIIATFTRFLAETENQNIQTQRVRTTYAMHMFRLFVKTGRSFEAMASTSFLDKVTNTTENRRSHGGWVAALRRFRTFWQEWGGYDATFDKADRQTLEVTLQVRPSIVDAPGQCGAGGISSKICTWPKQRCETCGTMLRCSKHDEHTQQACREIFWSTHLPDGTRVRGIAEFFNDRLEKLAELQSAEPSLIED